MHSLFLKTLFTGALAVKMLIFQRHYFIFQLHVIYCLLIEYMNMMWFLLVINRFFIMYCRYTRYDDAESCPKYRFLLSEYVFYQLSEKIFEHYRD